MTALSYESNTAATAMNTTYNMMFKLIIDFVDHRSVLYLILLQIVLYDQQDALLSFTVGAAK